MKGARQYEALAEMDVEIDNARAAWDWAVNHGQLERIDGAAEGLFRFYYFWRRGWAESDSVFGPAQEKLSAMVARTVPDRDSLPTSRYPDLLRVTAKILGLCILSASDDLGADFFQRALSLLDRPELLRHDSRRERALILEMRARCFWTSNPARSARFEEESLALYRELGDRWETATRLLHLAYVLLRAPAGGEPDDAAWVQARHHLEESLALYQDMCATRSVGLVLGQLGTLALLQGHREQGKRLLRQFITSWVEAGDTASLVHQLDSVAVTLSSMGRFDEGQFVMDEALALYKEMGDQTGEIMVRLRLGELLAYSGSYAESRAEARRVIAMARKPNDGAWVASARANLGRAALGEGKWAEAQRCWEQNAAYNRQAGNDHTLALSLAGLGLAALRLGSRVGARYHLLEALRLATAGGNLTTPVVVLGVLSVALLDAGRIEEAMEVYAAVSQLPHFARSRFWEDIAGRHIAAAAASLPPDVVAAAQARGRARDLMETAHEVLAELEAGTEETALASGGAPSTES